MLQTTNLSPIVHRQHSLLVLSSRLKPGHRNRGSKFSRRAGSEVTCRREVLHFRRSQFAAVTIALRRRRNSPA